MDNKVSVVIPVYNAEKTLCKCVESLEQGDYKNFEIILVDDCSKDHSWQICQELTHKYENIICIKNVKNSGVSFTRNNGMRNATGDYLCFVDSDDWVGEEYLLELVSATQKNPTDFIICSYRFIDLIDKTERDYIFNIIDENQRVPVSNLFDIVHNDLLQTVWNKIFELRILRENNIQFDETQSMGEDFQFVLDYMRVCNFSHCLIIPKKLYFYIRVNRNSLISKLGKTEIKTEIDRYHQVLELAGNTKALQDIYNSSIEQLKNSFVYHLVRDEKLSKKEKLTHIENIMNDGKSKLYYKRCKIMFMKETLASKNFKRYIPLKLKRILMEGYLDLKDFGWKVMFARLYCTLSNDSPKGLKIKYKYIMGYLEKQYGYILSKYAKSEEGKLIFADNLPIWVFWWDGLEMMPDIIQKCYSSQKKNSSMHDVILITRDNVKNYVDFPDYVWDQFEMKKLRIQHLADMIRVQLIQKYGGLWLDASVYCSKNIPEEYFKQIIFTLKGEKDERYVSENMWTTFVIGGRKDNILCSFLNDFFIEYCKSGKRFIDYYMFDCAIKLAYCNLLKVKEQIDALPKWQGNCYWLDSKLEEPMSEELFEELNQGDTVFHKIAWGRFNDNPVDNNTVYAYMMRKGE